MALVWCLLDLLAVLRLVLMVCWFDIVLVVGIGCLGLLVWCFLLVVVVL